MVQNWGVLVREALKGKAALSIQLLKQKHYKTFVQLETLTYVTHQWVEYDWISARQNLIVQEMVVHMEVISTGWTTEVTVATAVVGARAILVEVMEPATQLTVIKTDVKMETADGEESSYWSSHPKSVW